MIKKDLNLSLYIFFKGCYILSQKIKENFIKMIHELPDNVTVDEVVYHTYVKSQVMKGKRQLQEGKGIPHSEIEAEIE